MKFFHRYIKRKTAKLWQKSIKNNTMQDKREAKTYIETNIDFRFSSIPRAFDRIEAFAREYWSSKSAGFRIESGIYSLHLLLYFSLPLSTVLTKVQQSSRWKRIEIAIQSRSILAAAAVAATSSSNIIYYSLSLSLES